MAASRLRRRAVGNRESHMPKEWVIAEPWEGRERLAMALGVSPVIAQVLFNRGIGEVEAARQFLRPQMTDLIPPDQLPGASAAAQRIAEAARRGDKIVLYGDYDVDGVTGVAILWHCLKLAGANVDFYIPHRLEEGYGIHTSAVDTLADEGARLIVTVDCGITAIEPAARARQRGVELIITDHHQPHAGADGRVSLPDALLVHPGLPFGGPNADNGRAKFHFAPPGEASDGASPSDSNDAPRYPNPNLSGAGVAFKVAWAVGQALNGATKVDTAFREFLVDALGLAALGTVADVVPLTGENRLIARFGLAKLPESRLHGVQAIIQSAGLGAKKLSGYDIGFKLAPRLNAIGRMGHARLAVEMLTRASAEDAVKIAANLEQQNRARQTLERRIVAEAKQLVIDSGQNKDGCRAIVVAAPGWHAGVIGIVASRLVDEFSRPAVMIALENDVGQGSARSIRNFALHEALGACGGHLLTYGGHAMAAGLRIAADKVDAFREAFAAEAARRLTSVDLQPRLRIDGVVGLDGLTEQLVFDLSRLEPFGAGNTEPRLASDVLELAADPRAVGSGGEHLQLSLRQGGVIRKAIAFGMAKMMPDLLDHRRCRIAFRPMVNEWNGRRSVEMQVVDLQVPPNG